MKKLNLFEASIIGLLSGALVAAYVTYLVGTGGFVGSILNAVTLMPAFKLFSVPESRLLLATFIFIVAVFIMYGLLIGLLARSGRRVAVALAIAALLIAGISVQQIKGGAALAAPPEAAAADFAMHPTAKAPGQYFGDEATGDLNGDGIHDVAFLIPHFDAHAGTTYYLAAALATSSGHTGTNILFLGDKIEPTGIAISNGLIIVSYIGGALKRTASTTGELYADVANGVLAFTAAAK